MSWGQEQRWGQSEDAYEVQELARLDGLREGDYVEDRRALDALFWTEQDEARREVAAERAARLAATRYR